MFCTNCGIEINDDAVFCPACGFKTGRRATHSGNIMDDVSRRYPHRGHTQKSRILACILAVVLGSFGVHNFYLGYTQKAVGQLLLGIFSLGTISELWALYDAFLIFTGGISTDANGLPLGQ